MKTILDTILSIIYKLFNNYSNNVQNQLDTSSNDLIIENKFEDKPMSTKLTNNFTLEEMCYSDTAKTKGINNITSDKVIIDKLKLVCEHILQPVREHYGKPVHVNSGYRGPELNKAVGGASSSQHCKGEAADFEINGLSNYELACWIRDNLDFDQLILEYCDNLKNDVNSGWVHCSYKSSGNRKQCLTINKSGTKLGLIK